MPPGGRKLTCATSALRRRPQHCGGRGPPERAVRVAGTGERVDAERSPDRSRPQRLGMTSTPRTIPTPPLGRERNPHPVSTARTRGDLGLPVTSTQDHCWPPSWLGAHVHSSAWYRLIALNSVPVPFPASGRRILNPHGRNCITTAVASVPQLSVLAGAAVPVDEMRAGPGGRGAGSAVELRRHRPDRARPEPYGHGCRRRRVVPDCRGSARVRRSGGRRTRTKRRLVRPVVDRAPALTCQGGVRFQPARSPPSVDETAAAHFPSTGWTVCCEATPSSRTHSGAGGGQCVAEARNPGRARRSSPAAWASSSGTAPSGCCAAKTSAADCASREGKRW